MDFFKTKFKLKYKNIPYPVMYTELHDGKFCKTNMVNGEVKSDYIDIQEYSSALANIMLRPHGKKWLDLGFTPDENK
jgi:hypothetical protein